MLGATAVARTCGMEIREDDPVSSALACMSACSCRVPRWPWGTAPPLTEVASMQTLQPTGLMNHETRPQTYESLMCKLENIVCVSRVLVPCGSVCVSRVPCGSVCLVWVRVRCAVRLRMAGGGEHSSPPPGLVTEATGGRI